MDKIKPNEIRILDWKGDTQSILCVHCREDLLSLDAIKEITGLYPDPLDQVMVERWLENKNL